MTERPAYFDALPTPTLAAEWFQLPESVIEIAVDQGGAHPIDGRLDVIDLMGLVTMLRRFTQEEIAGDLMDHVEARHPEHAAEVQAVVDAYFGSLIRREGDLEGALTDLGGLPGADAFGGALRAASTLRTIEAEHGPDVASSVASGLTIEQALEVGAGQWVSTERRGQPRNTPSRHVTASRSRVRVLLRAWDRIRRSRAEKDRDVS